jgi:hypothetical protein
MEEVVKVCKRGHERSVELIRCPTCQKQAALAWRKINRDRLKKLYKQYYEANRNELKRKMREYDKNNTENHRRRQVAWRNKNREYFKKQRREYKKNRFASDPFYKFKHDISNLIRKSLVRRGHIKKSKSTGILGCDFETAKNILAGYKRISL